MLNDGSTIAIVVGGLVTVVTGFIAIARIMLAQSSNDREADRKERELLSAAIKDMAKSSSRVADATVKGASEAKQRNGHLAELLVQSRDMTMDAIHNVREQHVKHQIVEHEIIEAKTAGKK